MGPALAVTPQLRTRYWPEAGASARSDSACGNHDFRRQDRLPGEALVSPLHPGDPTGAETLERLAGARRYNRWMFERIRPWIGDRVLEIGSGIGSVSEFL